MALLAPVLSLHDPKTALALAVRGQHRRLRTLRLLHARCRRRFAFNVLGGTRSRRRHCLWWGRGGGELGVGEQVGRLARAHCVDGRGVGLERTVGRRVAEGEGGDKGMYLRHMHALVVEGDG
jgi:hypothetical protein